MANMCNFSYYELKNNNKFEKTLNVIFKTIITFPVPAMALYCTALQSRAVQWSAVEWSAEQCRAEWSAEHEHEH